MNRSCKVSKALTCNFLLSNSRPKYKRSIPIRKYENHKKNTNSDKTVPWSAKIYRYRIRLGMDVIQPRLQNMEITRTEDIHIYEPNGNSTRKI